MSFLDRAFLKAFQHRESEASVRETEAGVDFAPRSGSPEFAATFDELQPGADEAFTAGTSGNVDPGNDSSRDRTELLTARPVITPFSWTWPRIVQQLLNQAEYGFLHLARQLTDSSHAKKRQSIAFVSHGQGDGCTSVLLAVARVLGRQKDTKTLIVEANPGHPSLLELIQARGDCVKELRKSSNRISTPERPWELSGSGLAIVPIALQEHLVSSDRDRKVWEKSVLDRMPGWREAYDLILLDIGPVMQNRIVREFWWNATADCVISVVSSGRLASNPQGIIGDDAWEAAGIESLGVIETFS